MLVVYGSILMIVLVVDTCSNVHKSLKKGKSKLIKPIDLVIFDWLTVMRQLNKGKKVKLIIQEQKRVFGVSCTEES